MRECPNCKELNGDNNSRCWKCKTFLGTVSSYQKKCPDCGAVFNGSKDTCDYCGTSLRVYDAYGEQSYSKQGSDTWMYVLAFLIPILGIILGCVQLSKNENELGKKLIILSVVVSVACTILSVLLL